ncbi:hypothetical protein [Cohnella silvisoli]|uniref:DUF4231 domain-containing protein n=1 Tax=Cohnella silvisoli TaxID=2873699 RepID=A0ABV1L1M8_9BACL|nr:hypothetical protein [Cohnella silvisoli]MCD9025436.1 hypothetical protein [Cohnella silvisoli]
MEAEQKLLKLEEKLNLAIKNIKTKFVNTRVKARRFKVGVLILGVAITVILGLEDLAYGKEIGLILSGILTVLAGIDTLYNYYSKSVQEHDYYLRLTNLLNDIEYFKTGIEPDNYDVDKVNSFYIEFKSIRTDFHGQRIETVKNSFEVRNSK